MAFGMCGYFTFIKRPRGDHLADIGIILCKAFEAAATVKIAARIADMRDIAAVWIKHHERQGRPHSGILRILQRSHVDTDIRLLKRF